MFSGKREDVIRDVCYINAMLCADANERKYCSRSMVDVYLGATERGYIFCVLFEICLDLLSLCW
jgi:hypothetical protein